MNIKVVYHSSTGNTKKVAEAIGDILKTNPLPLKDLSISEPVDLLFIGDGIYAGNPSKETMAFIENLNPNFIKNAAVFATFGGQNKIGADIKSRLEEKGINIIGEPFSCKGKAWFFINRKHPTEDELSMAGQYAKQIVEKTENL